jgi:hypothetical protein
MIKRPKHLLTIVVLAALLAGCPTESFEGEFAPSCIALAGDTIVLNNGFFVWDKYTDAIQVDPEGNIVNPFPGFPINGTYTATDDQIVFSAESGQAPEQRFWIREGSTVYLLTRGQVGEWRSTGVLPACPLILKNESAN